MRYAKMLGLAVVAAIALMAFVGAGGASATVLCTTTPTNKDCPKGEDYSSGTQIIASAKTSVVLEDTEGNTLTTCAGGSLKGKTTNTGSATETVDGANEELVWSNCKASVVTHELGSFEIHADEKHNGVVTGKVIGITLVTPFFVSCVYGSGSSASLGTIESGETATFNVNAALSLISGGIGCPPSVRWTATYAVTSPARLYFAMTSA